VSEAIGQPGGAALPRPMGIGEILSAAFQLYQRYWRTLLAIAAVVVAPFTLLQYLLGHAVRVTGWPPATGSWSRPHHGGSVWPGWSPPWPGW
jgi:hypothetical protein